MVTETTILFAVSAMPYSKRIVGKMGACTSSSSSFSASSSSSWHQRLVLTRSLESGYRVAYQRVFDKTHQWETYLLEQLAREKSEIRRHTLLTTYAFSPSPRELIKNTLLSIFIHYIQVRSSVQHGEKRRRTPSFQSYMSWSEEAKAELAWEERLEKNLTLPVLKEILNDFIYNLRQTAQQPDSHSPLTNPAAPLYSTSLLSLVHSYRDDPDQTKSNEPSILEMCCSINYADVTAAALIPEIIQLMEYFLTTKAGDRAFINNNGASMLIEKSAAAGSTILPLIQLLRRHGFNFMTTHKWKQHNLWCVLIHQRHIGEVELFLQWLIFELTEFPTSDPSLIFPIDKDNISRQLGDSGEYAHIFHQLIDQLQAYCTAMQSALSDTTSLASFSSSSSSSPPTTLLLAPSLPLPLPLPLSLSLSDHRTTLLNATLSIVHHRMFTSIRLHRMLSISPTYYCDPQHDSNFPVVMEAFEKELTILKEKIVQQEVTSPTPLSSSSTSASSPPSTEQYPVRLSDRGRVFNLLKCLLGLTTPLLLSFLENEHTQTWFFRELDTLSPQLLIQWHTITHLNDDHLTRDTRIICQAPLMILLTQHRPLKEGDLIHTIYRKLFHLAFRIYPYQTASGTVTNSASSSFSSSSSDSSRNRHLLVSPSNVMMSSFLSCPKINDAYPLLLTGEMISVKLILDVFNECGLFGHTTLQADFFTHFLRQCTYEQLEGWIIATWNTSDTLHPTRLPEIAIRPIVRISKASTLTISETRVCERLAQEQRRWRDEVWPQFHSELNIHLISDLSSLVLSYLDSNPPLSITFAPDR